MSLRLVSARGLRRRVAALVLLLPAASGAADRERCGASYLDAQRARRSGALREAKQHVLTCLRECSESAAPDCATWLGEIERSLPSLVVAVQRDNVEVPAAIASIDGRRVDDRSRAVELDPGTHRIEAELGGERAVRDVVLHEGEKALRVVLVLRAPRAVDAAGADATRASAPRVVPWATFAFGGLAVAGAGVFAGLAIHGSAQEGELDRCTPRCNPADVSDVRRSYLVADVALAVSVVSIGVAVAAYFLANRAREVPRSSRVFSQGVSF